MIIKVVDNKAAPLIGKDIAYNQKPIGIEDKYKDEIKAQIDKGRKILIKDNGEFVEGQNYFSAKKKATSEVDINAVDYEDLFEGHWKKQVKRVEDNFDKKEEVEKVLS
ncbi:MAG: hypothetical protein ACOCRO_02995, partial [Halanaerobiales bacterium]